MNILKDHYNRATKTVATLILGLVVLAGCASAESSSSAPYPSQSAAEAPIAPNTASSPNAAKTAAAQRIGGCVIDLASFTFNPATQQISLRFVDIERQKGVVRRTITVDWDDYDSNNKPLPPQTAPWGNTLAHHLGYPSMNPRTNQYNPYIFTSYITEERGNTSTTEACDAYSFDVGDDKGQYEPPFDLTSNRLPEGG